MSASRITLAVENGFLPLPDTGEIAVLRARPDHDLSTLPRGRTLAVQGFRPWHDALAQAGQKVAPTARGSFALVLVAVTRSKAESLGLIAEAVALTAPGGLIAVDGQKTEGIDSLLREARRVLPVGAAFAKAHGKLFTFPRPDVVPPELQAWAEAARPRRRAGGFLAAPGQFSSDAPDPGSRLLAPHLTGLRGHVADLGAGWGYLAAAALKSDAVEALDLVEADHAALACARANITDPRAHFEWEDVTVWRPDTRYDAVICNPPFHIGRAADPALGQAFLATAAAILRPSGALWLVANRHLPYEATLSRLFREVSQIEETADYKLIRAGRPETASSRRQTLAGRRAL